jgi:hypothetical protein
MTNAFEDVESTGRDRPAIETSADEKATSVRIGNASLGVFESQTFIHMIGEAPFSGPLIRETHPIAKVLGCGND